MPSELNKLKQQQQIKPQVEVIFAQPAFANRLASAGELQLEPGLIMPEDKLNPSNDLSRAGKRNGAPYRRQSSQSQSEHMQNPSNKQLNQESPVQHFRSQERVDQNQSSNSKGSVCPYANNSKQNRNSSSPKVPSVSVSSGQSRGSRYKVVRNAPHHRDSLKLVN